MEADPDPRLEPVQDADGRVLLGGREIDPDVFMIVER